jgi:4-hydroxy-2-oxoglutarate aldolase
MQAMTSNAVPKGVFAPVATTFSDNGTLDLDAFSANMNVYAESPLDGVVIMGSNGEFPLLDQDEKLRLIEAGMKAIDGRRIVMAGTGVESTRGTIELTKRAADLGIDYALIVTPHYYKPRYDHDAYLAHYQAVADASPVPVLIYVMTAYTGVDLPGPLISELSKHPNIAGIKDSGGNAPKVGDMIAGAAPGFGVLAGSASFLYPALCLGATGGILALANIAPSECKQLYCLFEEGKHNEARDLQLKLLAPNAAVTSRFGIAGLKVAMDAVGLHGGLPRLPMQPLSDQDAEKVRATLSEAGIGRLD